MDARLQAHARRLTAGILTVLMALAPMSAVAEPSHEQKLRCATAYEQSQKTRKEGYLTASRNHLLVCADDACPAAMRSECIRWLGEVETAMPTVIVVAQDGSGNDVFDVAVTVDGTKVADKLDGKAIGVDPGVHTFRFVRAGSDAVEQKVLIREGEKRRTVTVKLGGAPTPATGHEDPPPSKLDDGDHVPTTTWILGAFGVVAIGAGAGLWVVGKGQKSDLDESCRPTSSCTQDQVDASRRTLLFGDVAMGVGIVALTAAIIVYVVRPTKPSSVSASIAPAPHGWAAAATFTF